MTKMNESMILQIRDLLAQHETIGIVVGKNPTVDEIGAALALYLFLQASGKKVLIAAATQPLVEHSNLVGIDKVKDSFEGEGGDLVVSFPYKEGEIDKVSYTLEEGFLNIVVKPGELGLNFTEQDVIYRRKGEYPGLIFTVGVPGISDLSSIFDINALKDTLIINIDNKLDNQAFGDVVVVDTNSSSVCEQVARLISSLGYDFDLDVAQNLLSGILDATNNFQNPNTTPQAFEMAAVLMQKGAMRKPVRQSEESAFTPESAGQVLQQFSQRQGQQQQRRDARSNRLGSSSAPLNRDESSVGQGNFPPRNPNQGQQSGEAGSSFAGQPQRQNQNPSVIPEQSPQNLKNPPEEWLTPKVYKGSTNV